MSNGGIWSARQLAHTEQGIIADRDHPLTCRWNTDPDALSPLGLPPLRSKLATMARAQILTEAIVRRRADPGSRISYSRRKEYYANQAARYRPPTYTYSAIVPTVDQLAALGILGHMKMPPGNLGWQSQMWASDDLIMGLPIPVTYRLRELIVLRDGDGEAVDYKETRQTEQMRRRLQEINEGIASVSLGLGGNPIRDGDPVQIERANVGAATHQLHRVFNHGKFTLGGRLYGPWWQNIPSEHRVNVTIDGEITHEEDYHHLHPTLLYAAAVQTMYGDPYTIDGWDRPTVKVAFNILINAHTPTSALRAIARQIGGDGAYYRASDLIAAIERKHAVVAPMFASGAGLALMRRDSDMAEAVLLRLAARGIVALPVHDSFIVNKKHKGDLEEAMEDELEKTKRHIGKK